MIRLATNKAIVGKPAKGFVFPKTGWVNLEFDSIAEVVVMLTDLGWPISAELDDSGFRDAEHFVSRQVFPVDIDHGMTLQELEENAFYQAFGCGYYTSASHSEEEHRFRVLFQLEQPIYDDTFTRALMEALTSELGGDRACTDPNRIFYGNPDAEYVECDDEKFLDMEVASALIAEQMGKWAERKTDSVKIDRPMTDDEKQHIIDLLCTLSLRYSGSYEKWRNLGFAMKSGGFTLGDFQYVSSRITNTKTPDVCERLWRSASDSGDVTMGTAIQYLREAGIKDDVIFRRETKPLSPQVEKLRKQRAILLNKTEKLIKNV